MPAVSLFSVIVITSVCCLLVTIACLTAVSEFFSGSDDEED